MHERVKGLPPYAILAMMAATGLATAMALLPIEGPPASDFALFLYSWMDVIRDRGLASISGEFSAYTPPYIYLLNLAGLIEPHVGTIAAIKLVNVPFVISCVWGIGAIVREITNKDRGIVAAAVAAVCPSLLLNAFAHGQCDAIFTSFLLWFVYFAIRERPALACLMFGLAFAFKQQAIFLSPLLLTLKLSRRMSFWNLLIIPLIYVVMMVPAALAGRPWGELLTIYVGQTELNYVLSLNAPNPWWFLNRIVMYDVGVAIGLLVSTAVGLLIVFRSLRLPRNGATILFVATVSAAALPYVMPKMASRYFFVADLLTIALAFARPRMWPAAVLIQLGSLIAVMSYFFAAWGTAGLAFVPMTLGVGLLAYEFLTVEEGGPQETSATFAPRVE
jgi:Gpi18-like mannosyltransferase